MKVQSEALTLLSNADYWSQIAGHYDSLYQDDYSQREDEAIAALIAQTFQPLIHLTGEQQRSPPFVLDVGCGTGLGRKLLPSSIQYVGCDIAPGMIEQARAHYPATRFDQMDAHQLHYGARLFDGLMALNTTFSYFENAFKVMHEMVRVLKPGAPLVVMALNRRALWRVKAGQAGELGPYQTRHSEQGMNGFSGIATSAHYYTATGLLNLFKPWFDCRVESLSFFGNWNERADLWELDCELCRLLPDTGHNLILTGVKRAENL